jgi:hypothetical protein
MFKGEDFFEYINFSTYNILSRCASSRGVFAGRTDIERRKSD